MTPCYTPPQPRLLVHRIANDYSYRPGGFTAGCLGFPGNRWFGWQAGTTAGSPARLAHDGGLYVPQMWPAIDAATVAGLAGRTSGDVACGMVSRFTTEGIAE